MVSNYEQNKLERSIKNKLTLSFNFLHSSLTMLNCFNCNKTAEEESINKSMRLWKQSLCSDCLKIYAEAYIGETDRDLLKEKIK